MTAYVLWMAPMLLELRLGLAGRSFPQLVYPRRLGADCSVSPAISTSGSCETKSRQLPRPDSWDLMHLANQRVGGRLTDLFADHHSVAQILTSILDTSADVKTPSSQEFPLALKHKTKLTLSKDETLADMLISSRV
jgi:hypothetical protein